jgi:release factor glutamine methyltransferase
MGTAAARAPQMKTVLEVIQATTEYFTRSGIESPRLNIEHLLALVLGKRRMDLYLEFDRTLSEQELTPLRELVRRRAQGEPLQHLLGTVEFLGLTLKCDARALIPRPETEHLCELLLAEAKAGGCAWTAGPIVDVGTGGGCIALALAKALPDARVTGIDLSEDALALARENAVQAGCGDRVSFVKGDLLSGIEAGIALAVANLPYIPTAEIPALQKEVLRDPVTALDGGADGLGVIRRLIAGCEGVLRPGGRLALEVGMEQGAPVVADLHARNFPDAKILKDYQGRDRFIFATHG